MKIKMNEPQKITPKECKESLVRDFTLLKNSGYPKHAKILETIIRLLKDDSFVLAIHVAEDFDIGDHHIDRMKNAYQFYKEFV